MSRHALSDESHQSLRQSLFFVHAPPVATVPTVPDAHATMTSLLDWETRKSVQKKPAPHSAELRHASTQFSPPLPKPAFELVLAQRPLVH